MPMAFMHSKPLYRAFIRVGPVITTYACKWHMARAFARSSIFQARPATPPIRCFDRICFSKYRKQTPSISARSISFWKPQKERRAFEQWVGHEKTHRNSDAPVRFANHLVAM